MKRIGMLAVSAFLMGILAAVPASADHACDSTVVEGPAGVYVVVDDPLNEHGGVWIYREANEQEGLQRNDSSCAGDENSDFIIF